MVVRSAYELLETYVRLAARKLEMKRTRLVRSYTGYGDGDKRTDGSRSQRPSAETVLKTAEDALEADSPNLLKSANVRDV